MSCRNRLIDKVKIGNTCGRWQIDADALPRTTANPTPERFTPMSDRANCDANRLAIGIGATP